jgi:hypothetical protein
MDIARVIDGIRKGFRAIAIAFVLATLIPLLLGIALSVPTGRVLSLIVSTLLLQANAAFVGLGFGLNPLFVLVVMTFVELGIVLAIYEILDTFAEQSERVQRFTKNTEEKMAKYPILHKYGRPRSSSFPCSRDRPLLQRRHRVASALEQGSVGLLRHVGWVLITGFLLLAALGFLQVIF